MSLRPARLASGLALCLLAFVTATAVAPRLAAQGRTDYFNVESPQVHPIEVARVNGHDYVLAVNTPDNSLEVWDTDETIPPASRFLARVPVGLEPVSVRWVPAFERAYVANFLGDSITAVSLAASGGPSTLSALVVQTTQVTDEPLDLVFLELPGGEEPLPVLVVTHMTLDAFGTYDPTTLAPIAPGTERLDALVPSGTDLDFDGALDDIALKEPWTPAVACGKLFILGHKGGNTVRYDFDIYSLDLATLVPAALGGIVSTGWNFAFAANDDLFLVGGDALNATLRDEANVAAAPTGFVKSTFTWIQGICNGNPVVRTRDVNLKVLALPAPLVTSNGSMIGTGAGAVSGPIPVPVTGPVPKGQALAQLTSVLPFPATGAPTKAFFTAFGSDRVGVIFPNAGIPPVQWAIKRIGIPPVAGPTGTKTGPRGLALKAANPSQTNDPGDRLYVLNRLDNSVSVIDPVADALVAGASFALNSDPTPQYIKDGRRFLYDHKLSGNGFSACSSCHTDARTDGLAWDLGGPTPVPIPPHLLPFPGFSGGVFPADKEFLVTQSLQGLLNFEVSQNNQRFFTNAPYHWRGDRADFTAFNGAFASLLGGSELLTLEMEQFEEFINSVNYPPNPKEPRTRLLTGVLGDPDDNDPTHDIDGSGARLGLKIFHTVNTDGFACTHCHSLTEGSNNVLTEFIAGVNPHPVIVNPPPNPNAPSQPMETAALRGLFQKEARLDRDGSSFHQNSPITGYEGLFHTGVANPRLTTSQDFNGTATINAFNLRFFNSTACVGLPAFCPNLVALNQFLHEYDFGVAPQVGAAYTVDLANVGSPATAQAFKDAEVQAALANAGVAVQARLGGGLTGFWYDQTVPVPVYREEPSGATFTRAALLALVTGSRDRLMLLSTPLGSERRVADPSGAPAILTGGAPVLPDLLPMVPNTAYAEVPQLSAFWAAGAPGHGGTHAHTVRLYQNALLIDGPAGGFGLCSIRHDPPRRFRVAVKGLRHGAALHLFIQDDPSSGPPITTLGPQDPGQVPMLELVLPLHPTDLELEDGRRIWETAVEMEPLLFFRLMAGRPAGFPGVIDATTDLDFLFQIVPEAQPAGTYSPTAWNQHWVRVVNADLTLADGGWQALAIEKGPDCP